MRRAAGRMTVKIQNLINELHHKTARFLVDNFDVILLPDFKTSGMVTREPAQDQVKDSPQPPHIRPPPVQEFPESTRLPLTAGRCLSSTRPTPQRQ